MAEALAALAAARCGGPPLAPGAAGPVANLDQAYRHQDLLVRHLCRARGGRPVGFKIGATSARAQRYLGLDGPFSGQLLSHALHASPARLSAAAFQFRLVEPEFAFRLGRDLPPRARPYGADEVADAVATLHPALEVVTSAFGARAWLAAGASALIADNGAHGALVLGEGRADWRRVDLAAQRVELRIDGRRFGTGSGAEALGHPLAALAWLATALSRRGRGLAAGALVTTGVVTPFALLRAGQVAVADYGPFGRCKLEFID